MRRRRWFAGCVAAVAVASAVVLTAGSVSTTAAGPSSAARPAHAPSARFLAEARAALVRYLGHGRAPAELVHPARAAALGTTAVGSYNWAGYADAATTSGTFTKVSGAWTTPKVVCTKEDTITSEWVGLDGWTSSTVEQDGTLGWCFEGVPTYFTWYEMYPAGTVEVGTTLTPGDKITASVVRSGTTYTLKVTDATHTANSFTTTATCALATCLDTSAEWIAERPAFSIGIAPLADYTKWVLSGATETASGTAGTIASYPTNDSITMIDATQSYNLTTTSALNAAGKSFTTTWLNSY
jgi:peptidase A4-like protein